MHMPCLSVLKLEFLFTRDADNLHLQLVAPGFHLVIMQGRCNFFPTGLLHYLHYISPFNIFVYVFIKSQMVLIKLDLKWCFFIMKWFKVHTDKVHTYNNVLYWVYSLKRMISEGIHLNDTKIIKPSYKLALLKEEMKAPHLFHVFH